MNPVGYLSLSLLPGEAGIRQTVEIMRDIARASVMDPSVQWQAGRIVEAAGVGSTDDVGAARAILNWITDHTTYRKDPQRGMDEQEVVQTPPWLIQQIAEGIRPQIDCDDLTVLVLALAGTIGIPGLIRVVSTLPSKDYNHVYGMVMVGGEWLEADPTRWAAARLTGQWPATRATTAHFDTML